MTYRSALADIRFVLDHVVPFGDLARTERFAEATPDGCPTDPVEKKQFLAAGALIGLLDESGGVSRPGRPEFVVVVDADLDAGGRPGPVAEWSIPVEIPALYDAGLDARAQRLPALEGRVVFEVDHPATQRYKRAKMGEHAGLRYVAVDFELDDRGEQLAAAGFDVGRTTVWVWEGVTMYLEPAAVDATLAQLRELSAPGSRVLASYMVPNSVPFGVVGSELVRHAFDAMGEGLRSGFERRDMNHLLVRHGFAVLTDTNSVDWADAASVSAWQTKIFRGERLVIARRN